MNQIFENWKKYKYSVPVYGAIILNEALDKVRCIYLLSFFVCKISFKVQVTRKKTLSHIKWKRQ